MPKRKSINAPPKRKRQSTDDIRGPLPFGTQAAAARAAPLASSSRQENAGTRQQKHKRPSIVPADSSTSDSDENAGNRRRDASSSRGGSGSAASDNASEVPDELSRGQFAMLRVRQRSIKQSIIRNKWEKLGDKAQERAGALLDGLERPLIAAQRNERRRIEAQAALGQLMRTLHRRLPRMPFPKDTRDWHFDQEALMASNRTLEASTTSQQHAIGLLKAGIRDEEAGVAADEEELRELSRNAKREARHRELQSAKHHPVLTNIPHSPVEDNAEAIRLAPLPHGALSQDSFPQDYSRTQSEDNGVAGVPHLDAELDPQLAPLVKLLNNHLESLEGNAAQATGIEAHVTGAATRLDALLHARLPEAVYAGLPAAI